MPPAVGVRRSPVSRLFHRGVGRYADRVLIAAGDRDTCEADLQLSRITALKGRGDATPLARLAEFAGEPPSRLDSASGVRLVRSDLGLARHAKL